MLRLLVAGALGGLPVGGAMEPEAQRREGAGRVQRRTGGRRMHLQGRGKKGGLPPVWGAVECGGKEVRAIWGLSSGRGCGGPGLHCRALGT